MKRLKVIEHKTIEKETNIYLPAYFVFQDDNGFEEYVMISEDGFTSVKFDIGEVSIKNGKHYPIYPHYIERCLTTKESFLDTLREAKEKIRL